MPELPRKVKAELNGEISSSVGHFEKLLDYCWETDHFMLKPELHHSTYAYGWPQMKTARMLEKFMNLKIREKLRKYNLPLTPENQQEMYSHAHPHVFGPLYRSLHRMDFYQEQEAFGIKFIFLGKGNYDLRFRRDGHVDLTFNGRGIPAPLRASEKRRVRDWFFKFQKKIMDDPVTEKLEGVHDIINAADAYFRVSGLRQRTVKKEAGGLKRP